MFKDHLLIHELIDLAIREDIGDGDHSSLGSIPKGTQGKARLLIKDSGIIAGLELAEMIVHKIDSSMDLQLTKQDGDQIHVGDIALTMQGNVHSILQAERLVLNFMQRMSGIATYTKRLVDIIEGTGSKLLDTRKTSPGLRVVEKWAVKIGGAENHRFGLYDMVMLKDNHIDYAGGVIPAIERTVAYLRSNNKDLAIEVETRNLKEVEQALSTNQVQRIMFDNFSPEKMVEAVKMVSGACETEASGGINEDTIRSFAETGVDFISVGALTHSVKSLDMSLKEY